MNDTPIAYRTGSGITSATTGPPPTGGQPHIANSAYISTHCTTHPLPKRFQFYFRAVLIGAVVLLSFMTVTMTPSNAMAKSKTFEKGVASWYGPYFHGRTTANGEIFNSRDLSAAHKSLPFGVVLRVKNLRNGRDVLVRVNDRGPYIHKRTLDLSHRAGTALKMLKSGVAPVAYEVISDRKGVPLNPANAFYVLLQDEKSTSRAQDISEKLTEKLGKSVRLLPSGQVGQSGRALCLGPFDNFRKAQKEFLQCEKSGVQARGIVEAPADGSELPLYAVPNIHKNVTVEKLSQTAERSTKTADPTTGSTALAVPGFSGTTLQDMWARTIEQGAYFLDITVNAIPGVASSPGIFRLHYSMLSGYLDLSS